MKVCSLFILVLAALVSVPQSAAQRRCPSCTQDDADYCRLNLGNWDPDLCVCTPGPSPIIVDLSGQGLRLTSARNGVRFDLNVDGIAEQIAWTAPGSEAGFLALDRNGNGIIDNGAELFGNFTPQPPSPIPNGFLALAEYDKPENGGNSDGLIDDHDAIFSSLRIWIDVNHNGYSEASELSTLPAVGVTSISLAFRGSSKRDQFGNVFRYRAKATLATTDKTGPWAYDVLFTSR